MAQSVESEGTYVSETSKHRALVERYCSGYGVDIGFGGDPVHGAAIRMDLPQPYAHTGDFPVQLGGDCRDLQWFRDDALDFVYSSHVLEDFDELETEPILREWTRVLRAGGNLVLLLPDQQRYLRYCEGVGVEPNGNHAIPHFSLEYVKQVAERIEELECAAEYPGVDEYSFVAVFRKSKSSSTHGTEVELLREKFRVTLSERDSLKEELRGCQAELVRLQRDFAVRVVNKLRRVLHM